MGRKKDSKNKNAISRENQNNNSDKANRPRKIHIGGDAKRSVAAIVLFALALVMILGFFGASGVAGEFINSVAGKIIGIAKWIFPAFLLLVGVILLIRKETSFYVTKIAGLGVALLGLVGLSHWFFDTDQMAEAASLGRGGGYIGYGLAYMMEKYLGPAGSMVILVALVFLGAIVAFNFSIIQFFSGLKKKEAPAGENNDEEIIPPVPAGPEAEIILPAEVSTEDRKAEEADLENNIKKIEFVDGPDRFVSPDLASGGYIMPDNPKKKSVRRQNQFERTMVEKGGAKVDNWQFPPISLLERSSGKALGGDVEKNAQIIESSLRNFGIEVERGEIKTGPSVTQYCFRPAVGVKIAKILSLQNDLSLALAAHPIRIEAPIPGKSLIGIEVPNKSSALVRLREIIEGEVFRARKSNLTLALGEDVSGNQIFGALDKMPHLLIAGATGTGKSVAINSIITTLLFQNSPRDLKFIMVDPKRVELSLYNGIPHLLSDVVVDNGKVINALKWAVSEMERRYRLLQDVGSRDIGSYKEKYTEGKKRKYMDPGTGEIVEEDMEYLPYIVIIIDELADLMGSHGKEVEGAVVRIAQMARAVGIHLIVSTQRPSVEVITGLIKANITTRIAFQVATQIDSRTILDMGGAEKLLGNGDLLFLSSASPKPRRIQGVFINEVEVKNIVKFIKNQKTGEEEKSTADISERVPANKSLDFSNAPGSDGDDGGDDMYEAAKSEVIRAKKASASFLQRRLRVGYARAARLLDILEDKGIIGPADGAKPREVYAAASENNQVAYEEPIEDQEKRDKWEL